jgi:hypothetical protein
MEVWCCSINITLHESTRKQKQVAKKNCPAQQKGRSVWTELEKSQFYKAAFEFGWSNWAPIAK